MSLREFAGELSRAERQYECGMISKEVYERKVRNCIYEIYKCEGEKTAERIAVAHGYKLKDIIKQFE